VSVVGVVDALMNYAKNIGLQGVVVMCHVRLHYAGLKQASHWRDKEFTP